MARRERWTRKPMAPLNNSSAQQQPGVPKLKRNLLGMPGKTRKTLAFGLLCWFRMMNILYNLFPI
jgi:hypothetical protein